MGSKTILDIRLALPYKVKFIWVFTNVEGGRLMKADDEAILTWQSNKDSHCAALAILHRVHPIVRQTLTSPQNYLMKIQRARKFNKLSQDTIRYSKIRYFLDFFFTSGMEFHLWEGKTIFILQRALQMENLKNYGKLLKGQQGQDQGPISWSCLSKKIA